MDIAYWALVGPLGVMGITGLVFAIKFAMKNVVRGMNKEYEDSVRTYNYSVLRDFFNNTKFQEELSLLKNQKELNLLKKLLHLWKEIKKVEIRDNSMIIFDRQEVLSLVNKLYDVSIKKLRLIHHITEKSSGIPHDILKRWKVRIEGLVKQVEENIETLEKILETFKVISLEQIELEEHFDIESFDELSLDVRLLQDQLEARLEVARRIDDEIDSLEDDGVEEFQRLGEGE